jgi:hypothetical protein
MSDHELSPVTRLVFWHVSELLDFVEARPIKNAGVASVMRVGAKTVNAALSTLVARGYLDELSGHRPRCFRLLLSRRQSRVLPPLPGEFPAYRGETAP